MMEKNKTYCMDCLEGLRQMDSESVDLTITSPPYDDLRLYNGYSFDFENIAKELYRVTKTGGVVVWVVGDSVIDGSESGTSFRQALYFKEIGFNLHDTMIYQKDGCSFPDKLRYFQVFEYMFVLSKGKPKTFNPLLAQKKKTSIIKSPHKGTLREKDGSLKVVYRDNSKSQMVRNNIWKYGIGHLHTTLDEYAFEHPAMFPEQLVQDHVLSWSNEGDLVLDPFMGSGTTGKMAILNNRDYIGFEISPEYCKIIDRRIKDAMKKSSESENLLSFVEG